MLLKLSELPGAKTMTISQWFRSGERWTQAEKYTYSELRTRDFTRESIVIVQKKIGLPLQRGKNSEADKANATNYGNKKQK